MMYVSGIDQRLVLGQKRAKLATAIIGNYAPAAMYGWYMRAVFVLAADSTYAVSHARANTA